MTTNQSPITNHQSPARLAITLGDVAGIGPEVVVRAVADESVRNICRPLVIGDPAVLRRAAESIGAPLSVRAVSEPSFTDPDEALINCWNPIEESVVDVPCGQATAEAGRASYEYLIGAIWMTLGGDVDGIVTAPISKLALSKAGILFPGHTEILAHECGVNDVRMMLYLPSGEVRGPCGLSVAHVTLHTSIASVPGLLSTPRVLETIRLIDRFLRRVGCGSPRIGVCALNPHAGEGGLFGDEEPRIIAPAVASAAEEQIAASGPFPADTLLKRAVDGEFDGVVAMYHDQGHIALKLLAFGRAVNVTLGLPIVRTSPSHGTAYDIAGLGKADPAGMIAAIRVAARLSSVSDAQQLA